jgi:MFS superfamily sulfate permease-like transporter
MVSSLLGGFGGCGLIPQTVLNMKSGGGGPLSSLVYAVSMAVFVLILAPLVGQVSQAALAGIMLSVAFSTVQFGPSLTIIKRAFGMAPPVPLPAPGMPAEPPPLVALVSLAATSYLCFKVDMATGIVAGVVLERVLGAIGGLFSGPKPATA